MTVGRTAPERATRAGVRAESVDSRPAVPLLSRLLDRMRRRPVLAVVMIALLARTAAVVVLGPLRPGVAIPDEQQYIELAESVASGRGAEAWFPGYGQSLYDATGTFMRPLAAMTWAFGSHQLNGQILAAVFGVAAAALTYLLAARLVSPTLALLAGAVAALLPSQVLWSSVGLRESMVWAGLAALALVLATAAAETSRRRLVVHAVAAFALLFCLGHLREQTALVAGIALAGAALLTRPERRWTIALGALAVAITAPLAAGLGPGGYYLAENALPQLATIRANLSLGASTSIVETTPLLPDAGLPSRHPSQGPGASPGTSGSPAEPGAGGPSSSPTPVAVPTPDGAVVVGTSSGEQFVAEGISVRNLPAGIVAVALRPFPWEPPTSSSMSLARFEALAWAPLYLLALVGLAAAWRHRRVLAFPIVVAVGVLLLSALVQGNIGTAFRHRGQVLWVVAVLAVVGLQSLRDRQRRAA